jgi:hypothetical protein
MMRAAPLLAAAFLTCLAFLAPLSGCNLAPGGGTDVGNPEVTSRVSGSLIRPDGTPAPWIPIQIRPKAFVSDPDSLQNPSAGVVPDQITDTQGFFTFDSVPKGDYRIQAMDTSSHGATMEFTVDGHTPRINLAAAHLDTTGSISGKINYRGPPKPIFPKIIIAVYGTDRWTIANDAGDFTLSEMPPGTYKLSISMPGNSALKTIVPETGLAAGGKASVGTVDLGP